jgi:hypothetical protein
MVNLQSVPFRWQVWQVVQLPFYQRKGHYLFEPGIPFAVGVWRIQAQSCQALVEAKAGEVGPLCSA